MKRQIKAFWSSGLAVVLALGTGGLVQAQHDPKLDPQKIANASGAEAKTKDSVIRIEWPRKDVAVKVDGMPLKPFAGLGSWAAFTPAPHGAMMIGDTVVSQDELTPAMDAAFEQGLEVTALHNHFFFDEPKVYFIHIGGHGDQEKLAAAVKSVWDAIKKVRAENAKPATGFGGMAPQEGKIDAAPLEKILGHKSQEKDGGVKVSIGREGAMHRITVGEAMGVNTVPCFC